MTDDTHESFRNTCKRLRDEIPQLFSNACKRFPSLEIPTEVYVACYNAWYTDQGMGGLVWGN
jgi:hypothetical protein